MSSVVVVDPKARGGIVELNFDMHCAPLRWDVAIGKLMANIGALKRSMTPKEGFSLRWLWMDVCVAPFGVEFSIFAAGDVRSDLGGSEQVSRTTMALWDLISTLCGRSAVTLIFVAGAEDVRRIAKGTESIL